MRLTILAQVAVIVGVHGLEDHLRERLIGHAQRDEVVVELAWRDAVVLVGVDGLEDEGQRGVDGGSLGVVRHRRPHVHDQLVHGH